LRTEVTRPAAFPCLWRVGETCSAVEPYMEAIPDPGAPGVMSRGWAAGHEFCKPILSSGDRAGIRNAWHGEREMVRPEGEREQHHKGRRESAKRDRTTGRGEKGPPGRSYLT